MAINLVFDHQIFCIQRYGGISRYFAEIASRLQKDVRFRVHVVAPLHLNKYLSSHPEGIIGCYLPYIPRLSKPREVFNRHLSNISFRLIRPDIIHETYYRWNGHKSSRSKRIVTVHDMIHEKFPQYFPNDDTAARKSDAVERADHVICVSENTKNDLIEFLDVDPSKISVIYHGSSFDQKCSSKSTRRDNRPRPFILFVGQRNKYKNYMGLLRAYSQSRNLQKDFDLVCFGGGPLSDEEHIMISELKIDIKKIHFVHGDDAKLMEYYHDASVFVYPSFYEGFGIPLLEAMGCQCPIACSNTSCFREIAGDAAEYFDPTKIESISDAIQRIVYSTATAKELISNGNERIKLFSWERALACIADVYCAVL